MRIFEEKQEFNRVWLFLIGTISFLGWLYLLYLQVSDEKNLQELIPWIVSGFILFLLFIFFYSVQLYTRVDSTGVRARFSPPGFFKKYFRWNEIKEIYVREYAPIAEYGGWGVRGFGRAKAYNVKGKYGIQIVTRDKKKFLIGTQEPDKVRRVLKFYQNINATTNY